MDTAKLKMKIGIHEFEAEGPADVVQEQFAAFRELVATAPATPPPGLQHLGMPSIPSSATVFPHDVRTGVGSASGTATLLGVGAVREEVGLRLGKIMKHDGRIVSLTARAGSVIDEILLILLGQKDLRNNESVTGGEVIDGLRMTGHTLDRVDYHLDKLTLAGQVITLGTGRARRYRLTNQGFAKAQEIAMEIVQTVA